MHISGLSGQQIVSQICPKVCTWFYMNRGCSSSELEKLSRPTATSTVSKMYSWTLMTKGQRKWTHTKTKG